MPQYVYVQAVVNKVAITSGDPSDAINFRHVIVPAEDPREAYAVGARVFDMVGYNPTQEVINDYVVPIPE